MPAAAKVERIDDNGSAGGGVGGGCGAITGNGNEQQQPKVSNTNDPASIANTIIEKKIRNLEKRKAHLLELKAQEKENKQLQPDQIEALKKLDSVSEMIDMLKEINKNISKNLNKYAKQQKKEQQEKMIERNHCELERIKLFLRIQKILPFVTYLKQLNMKQLDVDDSTNGDDGTAAAGGDNDVSNKQFYDKRVDALENLAQFTKENSENDANIDAYAEKIYLILDGSKKEYSEGVSNLELKEFCIKIIENKYLENITAKQNTSPSESADQQPPVINETVPSLNESPAKTNEKKEVNAQDSPIQSSSPAAESSHTKQQVESDLQKDPAVIASGYAYSSSFTNGNCPPLNFLPATTTTTAAMEYSPILIHQSVGSIPSQQFNNQNFVNFIPNKVQMFDQAAAAAAVPVIPINHHQVPYVDKMNCNISSDHHQQDSNHGEKFSDPSNGKMEQQSESSEKSEIMNGTTETASQQDCNESKVNDLSSSNVVNGHGHGGVGGYQKRSNYRGRGSGRGGAGAGGGSSYRGGRSINSNKNFGGYFHSGGGGGIRNGVNNPAVNNYNGGTSRPIRHNGGAAARGSYRGSNERGGNRNNNNPNLNNRQGPTSATPTNAPATSTLAMKQ